MTYGIFLSEKRGTINGTDKGVKFFECPDGHGLMVKSRRIKGEISADKVDLTAFKAFKELKDAEAKEEEAGLAEIAAKKEKSKFLINTFKEIDTDGNKLLEKKEFVDHFSKKMGLSEADAEKLFDNIDVTNGGTVSLSELNNFISKYEKGEVDGLGM